MGETESSSSTASDTLTFSKYCSSSLQATVFLSCGAMVAGGSRQAGRQLCCF